MELIPNTKEFLTKEIFVNSYQADFTGKLSIHSLFSLFQEIAWEHAGKNAFGYEDLKNQGLFWALSRMHVEIQSLPKWTETCHLTTWPSGVEGPFALRDYRIYNNEMQVVIGATSSWLVVDINTRRPQRPDAFKNRMPICESIRATASNAPKIIQNSEVSLDSYNLTAKVSDIDVNGHINNTKYIEWAINSLSQKFYSKIKISGIDINFLSEGFVADELTIETTRLEDNIFVSRITRLSDKRDLALVKITALPV